MGYDERLVQGHEALHIHRETLHAPKQAWDGLSYIYPKDAASNARTMISLFLMFLVYVPYTPLGGSHKCLRTCLMHKLLKLGGGLGWEAHPRSCACRQPRARAPDQLRAPAGAHKPHWLRQPHRVTAREMHKLLKLGVHRQQVRQHNSGVISGVVHIPRPQARVRAPNLGHASPRR